MTDFEAFQQIRSLRERRFYQQAELRTCTTAAMRRCVQEAIADTDRQIEAIERAPHTMKRGRR